MPYLLANFRQLKMAVMSRCCSQSDIKESHAHS